MDDIFLRTGIVIGDDKLKKLNNSSVAVFGVGGVGSYAVEALARSGVGKIAIFDMDCVEKTNINRQIVALNSTIGRPKVEVMKDRVLDINPNAEVSANMCFYSEENSKDIDFLEYDYIIDAIDTISSKIEIIKKANENKKKVISCMGTGNKLDPCLLVVDDIYRTSVCPLARVMRRELRKLNIEKLKVVYSKEVPREPKINLARSNNKDRPIPGSVSFVPPVAGMIMAGEVIREIIEF